MRITPESIENLLKDRGGWMTRLEIAEAHGKRKTTHVIQQIKQAVKENRIVELQGFDHEQRDCKVYLWWDQFEMMEAGEVYNPESSYHGG